MFVVGTAGHVDHGKSTLVKALTGIDPDRLQEEQERAMTIDLGFAWLTLPSGREISLVDVPGHERFIKNMLAGIGGIDAALLVIAADEGPMPQTAEHLAILDLLGSHRGIVVVTKCELVDADWLALVQEEIHELLAPTVLAGAPILPVSALVGTGLTDLLGELDTLLASVPPPLNRGRPRLPIDRVFTMAGFGTVVTGTLVGGALALGDEIEVQPGARRGRIRGLQSHRRKVERAEPGNRVAVNITGLTVTDLSRGDLLTSPGWLQSTDRLDLRLRLIPTAPRPLRQNDLVDLFTGATEVGGRLTLLDSEEMPPGSEGWVQIRLERPIAATQGDRYIIRQPSPSLTIGGGTIVDAHPRRHRRFHSATLQELVTLADGSPTDRLLQVLERGPLDLRGLAEQIGQPLDELASLAIDLLTRDLVINLEAVSPPRPRPTDLLMTASGWQRLNVTINSLLTAHHRQFPLRPGMPKEELRRRLNLSARLFDRVIALAATRASLVDEGATLRAVDHQIRFSTTQQQAAERILAALAAEPTAPPSLSEIEAEPELMAALAHQGQIVRVNESAAFLTTSYQAMVDWTLTTIDTTGSVTVAGLRDHFATSRKHALALLEHLDQRRLTRRQGDARIRW